VNSISIGVHGIIGNMRSAALISVSGDIDFFCYPEFDSPTVFCSLLDENKGGGFSLRPSSDTFHLKQCYVPETNVLLTRFISEHGLAEVSDFMPVAEESSCHCIMRHLTVLQGAIEFSLRCSPKFNYARSPHRAERSNGDVLFTPQTNALPAMLLQGSVELEIHDDSGCAFFTLSAGESASFIFGAVREPQLPQEILEFVQQSLKSTCGYWRKWAAKSLYQGRWREMVTRSALVLKLLTSAKHGSLLAAPTFGLPEEIGGVRNWDYRYTWLRDASFTVYALSRLGFVDEGQHFVRWMKDRLNWDGAQGPLEVMYRLDGTSNLPETELAHLAGFRDSRPVRIGNGASKQLQLDIYGEFLDALYLSSKYSDGPSHEGWQRLMEVMRWLSKHWRDPDEGIWEVRGERKEFLHSRLMCWVAFDRTIRLGAKRSLPGPYGWLEECRDAIAYDIHENFWNAELGAFVQFKGAKEVDAATLLMPLFRFISPVDPRWLSTLEVIERDLTVDTLVKRYRTESNVDGLRSREGSFTACSFWFVEALARSRQVEKAHLLFNKLISYANPLGLYSEELSATGEHLGNFPQALTHLALVSAATYLDRRLETKQQEPWS
jgi:GH15 family glucan-1,4-alpha-glucosidase